MRVRLSMYLEWIQPVALRKELLPSAENDPAFQDVRIYHDDLRLAEGTLYISMYCAPPEDAGDKVYFICNERSAKPGCNCIIIEDELSELAVFDKLHDCSVEYSNWISKLDQALIRGTTFQEILDLSENIIKNPIVILDSHYNFLAGSRKISPHDGKLYDVKKNGHPSPDTLLELAVGTEESDREYSGSFTCGATYRIAKRFGSQEMMADFKNEGFINLCIVIRFSVEKYNDAQKGILDILCDHLDVLVKRDDRLMSSSGGIDFFIDQLINGANPDQISKSIGIPRKGEYVTIMLEATMDDIKSGKVAIVNVMNGILPQSRAFCHENKFYSIVTYSTDKKSQAYYELQLKRMESLCNIVKCRCGISNMFSDLVDLQYSCVQAENAVRLIDGTRAIIPPENDADSMGYKSEKLCFYKDVMLFHVIDRTLGEARRYCFYPENFARMLKDDRQHNTNNCDILAEFLLNGQKYTTAAEKLHMHRNNVLYRLNRMQEKYNISYESRDEWLMLTICCLAAKMFPPTFPGE